MVISDRTKGCCSSDLNEPRTLTMTNLLNLTHTTPEAPAKRGGALSRANHGLEEQLAQNARRRLGRCIGYARRSQFCSELAEGEGFEPWIPP
jgi:hypothetical protein